MLLLHLCGHCHSPLSPHYIHIGSHHTAHNLQVGEVSEPDGSFLDARGERPPGRPAHAQIPQNSESNMITAATAMQTETKV